jgi:hypothetical protein
VIVETKHPVSLRPEIRVPACVAPKIFGLEMLTAIQFDYQPGRVANEIDNVGSDRRLPPETGAMESMRAPHTR